MKRHICRALLLALAAQTACAQLTLEDCQEMARRNYPVIRQLSLVEQSRDFTVSNASKGNLPQVSLGARAQYQSDATKLLVQVPGIDFKGLSRDQYDVSLNVSQTVYDGGSVSSARELARRQGAVDYEQVRVALHEVRGRVEELFFGILTLDERIKSSLLLQDDLRLTLASLEGMVRGGTANQGDIDAVKAELVGAMQAEASLRATRKAYGQMLSTFIGKDPDKGETLVKPALDEDAFSAGWGENLRPELDLYGARTLLAGQRMKALDTGVRPHLSLFAQAGYANPALNLFKTGWHAYYKVGATLSWNFGGFYTRSNDRHKLSLEMETWMSERDAFLLNTTMQSQMQGGTIESLRRQIELDDELIALRQSIRAQSEAKVAGGTETVNEMLRDINAVSDALLQRNLHELELMQETQKLKTLRGN